MPTLCKVRQAISWPMNFQTASVMVIEIRDPIVSFENSIKDKPEMFKRQIFPEVGARTSP